MKLTLLLATGLAALSITFGGSACDKDDKDDGGGTGGGAWLVGQDGTMINVSGSSEVGGYDLESRDDFLDIACRGALDAWVVGERGTLLRTSDAGASWWAVDLETTLTLRAVAASEREMIYVVGDGGLAMVSADSGETFSDLSAGERSWTAVATDYEGDVAILGAADGSLWRYDGEVSQVHGAGASIRAVSMSAAGRVAVAVGDDGLMLRSLDGGVTWTQVGGDALPDLHDVWVTGDGGQALAVGAGGVLVTAAGEATVEVIAGDVTLRGIHLSAEGAGLIVGDGGTALQSVDRGRSWTQLELGTDRTLYAVDDIHLIPHL